MLLSDVWGSSLLLASTLASAPPAPPLLTLVGLVPCVVELVLCVVELVLCVVGLVPCVVGLVPCLVVCYFNCNF